MTVYVSGAPQPDVYWRKDRRDVDTLTGRFRVIDGGTLQVGPNFKKKCVMPLIDVGTPLFDQPEGQAGGTKTIFNAVHVGGEKTS